MPRAWATGRGRVWEVLAGVAQAGGQVSGCEKLQDPTWGIESEGPRRLAESGSWVLAHTEDKDGGQDKEVWMALAWNQREKRA